MNHDNPNPQDQGPRGGDEMRETLKIAGLEPQPKPTPRKYDRRSITSAENGRRAWGVNLDAQVAELEQRIREMADSTSDERLRFEALRYLRDCRAGKPFTALNPVERKQGSCTVLG
jgi:hypothetical protein